MLHHHLIERQASKRWSFPPLLLSCDSLLIDCRYQSFVSHLSYSITHRQCKLSTVLSHICQFKGPLSLFSSFIQPLSVLSTPSHQYCCHCHIHKFHIIMPCNTPVPLPIPPLLPLSPVPHTHVHFPSFPPSFHPMHHLPSRNATQTDEPNAMSAQLRPLLQIV